MNRTASLPGTVGVICTFEGLQSRVVQGYSLVAGLANTGSRECPEALRRELTATMAKYRKLYGETSLGKDNPSGDFLTTRQTAVVKVSGIIPAGASQGDHFDLYVQALPNTGTTSLEGGRLFTCDLTVYAGPLGQASQSKPLGQGSGPVFINPFDKKTYRGTVLLRRSGFVLNGGTVMGDRRISLRLNQSSYGMARSIEQKINSLFGPPPGNPVWQTARATSPDVVEIRIPPAYRHQVLHFLGLIRNTYVRSDPSYLETTAGALARQVGDPMANAAAISFAWESMGRSILPLIQPLYTNANQQAAFYSARAGARLGDHVAIDRLEQFLGDSKSKYRYPAVETLGSCTDQVARRILRKRLEDSDLRVRIAAYESLARMDDDSIDRRVINQDGLILDVVRCESQPLVYVTRSGQARVALFGKIHLDPPVFYTHPDDSVTITANAGDQNITLLRKSPSGKSSGGIKLSTDLAEAVGLMAGEPVVDPKDGKVYGLGLPYSHIVAVLNQLCKDGSVPSKFKMEDLGAIPSVAEDSIGRPERD